MMAPSQPAHSCPCGRCKPCKRRPCSAHATPDGNAHNEPSDASPDTTDQPEVHGGSVPVARVQPDPFKPSVGFEEASGACDHVALVPAPGVRFDVEEQVVVVEGCRVGVRSEGGRLVGGVEHLPFERAVFAE
jgi:hypothetical protein